MTTHTVEFVDTGESVEVAETQTMLRACIDAGLVAEYSCRVGMCLACSAEIIDGEVTQPAARALTEQEKTQYALTCMARPKSDVRLRGGIYPPSIEADAEAAAGDD